MSREVVGSWYRTLIYTGIMRGSNLVVIIGRRKVLAMA